MNAVHIVSMFEARLKLKLAIKKTVSYVGLSDKKDLSAKKLCLEADSPAEAFRAKEKLLAKGYIADNSQETKNSIWVSFEDK